MPGLARQGLELDGRLRPVVRLELPLAAVEVQPPKHLLVAHDQVVAGLREVRVVVGVLRGELHAQERLLGGGIPGHDGEFLLWTTAEWEDEG